MGSYTFNDLGDSIGVVALAVLVFDRTNDVAPTAGFFLVAKFLPALLATGLTARLDQLPLRHTLPTLYFLEALVFAAQGKKRRAATHFNRAEGIFTEHKSERDLLYLYYHYGLLLLEEEQMEQAFFCFEEGNYLAKKLKLAYWKGQLAYARGLLELKGDEASPDKALKHFEEAERYAERAPYPDLLARIRTQMAVCRG